MIKDEKNELLFRRILAIVLLIGVVILGIFFIYSLKDEKKPTKKMPVIKEDFKNTNFKLIKSYNDRIYLDNKNIYLESNDENIDNYLIGTFGNINKDISPSYKETKKLIFNNYEIVTKDNYYYYLDRNNNTLSNNYKAIVPIKTNDQYNYFILIDDVYHLFDIKNNELITLEDNIKHIYFKNDTDIYNINLINNNKYLIVSNDEEKYGVIDFKGNIIIDFKYDYISTYKTDDTFIVKLDNKYGIINDKDNIINGIIYDNIFYYSDILNYSMLLKDNNISIYYDNNIADSKIKYTFKDDIGIKHIYHNNKLYLNIIPSEKDNEKSYIIDKNGIQNEITDYYEELYNNEDNLKYFYKISTINNQSKITFYDLDFNNLYSIYIPYIETENNIILIDIIKDNIAKISYVSNNIKNYYIDLLNLKQLEEKEVLLNYFDNGYSFTIDDNLVLNIYKNNTIIDSYDNITTYLGGYLFLEEIDNKYNIQKIEFKK